jgi:hypothetical protein
VYLGPSGRQPGPHRDESESDNSTAARPGYGPRATRAREPLVLASEPGGQATRRR